MLCTLPYLKSFRYTNDCECKRKLTVKESERKSPTGSCFLANDKLCVNLIYLSPIEISAHLADTGGTSPYSEKQQFKGQSRTKSDKLAFPLLQGTMWVKKKQTKWESVGMQLDDGRKAVMARVGCLLHILLLLQWNTGVVNWCNSSLNKQTLSPLYLQSKEPRFSPKCRSCFRSFT